MATVMPSQDKQVKPLLLLKSIEANIVVHSVNTMSFVCSLSQEIDMTVMNMIVGELGAFMGII